MKTLAAFPLLLALVGCGSLNPSAIAQSAGAGALKSIQEGKGLSAEGLAKAAAEGAGVPTDAEGLAKKAGLPTDAAGLAKKAGVPGDSSNALSVTSSLLAASAAKRGPSNEVAKPEPPSSSAVSAASLMAQAAPARPQAAAPRSEVAPSPPSVSPSVSPSASPAAAAVAAAAPDSDVPGATFRVAKLKVDEIRLSNVACRLAQGSDVNGLFGPAVIAAGFKEREARLDACSRRATDTRVTWVAVDSKTVKVRAVTDDAKVGACVERALMGAVAMVDGSCGATLTHGKSK